MVGAIGAVAAKTVVEAHNQGQGPVLATVSAVRPVSPGPAIQTNAVC